MPIQNQYVTMAVSERTLHTLLDTLDSGRWLPGARLPPERQLASELGVGRSSLRIALAELERRGRIRRHVGQGTFVTSAPVDERSLRLGADPTPADIFELRLMIEPQIAAAAAMRARDTDIAALRLRIDEGAEADDWTRWEETDTAFHRTLAEAGRNPLLTGVLDSLRAMRRGRTWGETRARTLNPTAQATYVGQHRAITDAIAERDPPAAAAAMRAHLTAVNRAMVGDAADLSLISLP